VSYW